MRFRAADRAIVMRIILRLCILPLLLPESIGQVSYNQMKPVQKPVEGAGAWNRRFSKPGSDE
jgi:hypothetical protein